MIAIGLILITLGVTWCACHRVCFCPSKPAQICGLAVAAIGVVLLSCALVLGGMAA